MPEEEFEGIEPIDFNEWLNYLNEIQVRYNSLKPIIFTEERDNIEENINKMKSNINMLVNTYYDMQHEFSLIVKELDKVALRRLIIDNGINIE